MEIVPIQDLDLEPVCNFLHTNFPSHIPVQSWLAAFRRPWSANKPNNGFMLLCDEGRMVGVVGAIYSQQRVGGQLVDICNINSWFVLPEYRSDSIYLLLALIRQKRMHFTILTPRLKEMEIYEFLKFRPIATRMIVTPNLPWPFARLAGVCTVTDSKLLQQVLTPEDAVIHKDHDGLPWLKHIAVGVDGAFCHVIYQLKRLKHLPTAEIIHVSDRVLFERYRLAVGNALLLRGVLFSRIEARFQPQRAAISMLQEFPLPKLLLSDLLEDSDVQNIYSEISALDLDGLGS
jgi:hypothetical protein